MKKVTGLGGIFFKTKDPAAARDWYKKHLGINSETYGCAFSWQETEAPDKRGYTVWSPFDSNTEYFDPGRQDFMVNYRVADLPALMEELRVSGVQIVGAMEQHENGKFAWVLDGDGNKIELWEPVPPDQDPYLP